MDSVTIEMRPFDVKHLIQLKLISRMLDMAEGIKKEILNNPMNMDYCQDGLGVLAEEFAQRQADLADRCFKSTKKRILPGGEYQIDLAPLPNHRHRVYGARFKPEDSSETMIKYHLETISFTGIIVGIARDGIKEVVKNGNLTFKEGVVCLLVVLTHNHHRIENMPIVYVPADDVVSFDLIVSP